MIRKLGLVRLDQYGLVLTDDDRILSTRSTVLDDGVGGKIVGWRDSDLAAAELEKWTPEGVAKKPEKVKAPIVFATTVVAPPAPLPRPAPVVVPPAPLPAPIVVVAPAPVPPPQPVVAPQPPVEEDEWEWEIAMARARAVAEEVETAVATLTTTPPIEASAWTADDTQHDSWSYTAPPVAAAPIAAMPPSATKPLPRVAKVTSQPIATPAPAVVNAPAPSTVIPVPALAAAVDPRSIRPVMSSSRPLEPYRPQRFAKATSRVDDTIRTKAVPPANDDRTKPYVSLPQAASTVGLPTAKRVAAKQR